jgi:hypothetical protein
MIGPSVYSNVARFINSNSGSMINNCLPIIGLLKYEKTEPGEYEENY